ncbi:MAG: mechanosensitive ion channel family protein, partial [Burkholderiaceae bacterium]
GMSITDWLGTSTDWRIWLVQVFAVVLVTVSMNFVLLRLLNVMVKRVQLTASLWDDAMLEAARLPLRLLVWTFGLTVAVAILRDAAPLSIWQAWPDVRKVLHIGLVAWFLTRFIRYVERNILASGQGAVDATTAQAVAKLLRLSVVITTALVLIQNLGYSISGVLAFGGIGGIAVGFAAKDLLANFFGGLIIYLDRPFKVGDWVRSPDRPIEGTVEEIGWRQTRIRTFDKRPLYIPNSMFASIAVENPSRMTNRRIDETIGVRYADSAQVALIAQDIRHMLASHPDIDPNQTQIVHFNGFGASQLDIMVYAFTRTTEWVAFHAVKEDVLLQIVRIVHQHGADFAFPTRTVHWEPAAPALRPASTQEAT